MAPALRDSAASRAQRPDLRATSIIWEIHEAFAAQVLVPHQGARKSRISCASKAARRRDPSAPFRASAVNPNGGSVALGHPFGATGARILSQAVKELSQPAGRPTRDCQHLRGWRSGRRCPPRSGSDSSVTGRFRQAYGMSDRHVITLL